MSGAVYVLETLALATRVSLVLKLARTSRLGCVVRAVKTGVQLCVELHKRVTVQHLAFRGIAAGKVLIRCVQRQGQSQRACHDQQLHRENGSSGAGTQSSKVRPADTAYEWYS